MFCDGLYNCCLQLTLARVLDVQWPLPSLHLVRFMAYVLRLCCAAPLMPAAGRATCRAQHCFEFVRLRIVSCPRGSPAGSLLVDRVSQACCRRPQCFESLVGSLAREEPIASTGAMILMRTLLGTFGGHPLTFKVSW